MRQHLVPGTSLQDLRGEVAEGPGGLAGAPEATLAGHLRERVGELVLQRGLERIEVLAAGLFGAVVVDDAVGRPQVRCHLAPVPGVTRDDDAGRRPGPALESVEQRLLAWRGAREEL